MTTDARTEHGLIVVPSKYSVGQAIGRLQEIVRSKGFQFFALIDHAAEAAKSGLEMRPTQVLIFGNARAGTPVMQAVPAIAIELPLRVLAWEDADKRVWVAYEDPQILQQRYAVPEGLMQNVSGIGALVERALT